MILLKNIKRVSFLSHVYSPQTVLFNVYIDKIREKCSMILINFNVLLTK